MWSDDDVADSILESISHAESVMSGRDARDTYGRFGETKRIRIALFLANLDVSRTER